MVSSTTSRARDITLLRDITSWHTAYEIMLVDAALCWVTLHDDMLS